MAWKRASDIGTRIRDLRLALGHTQEQFGDLAGVEGQQVSEWENRRSKPSPARLERLARRLGIPTAVFQEGGPRPSTVVATNGGRELEEIAADPHYRSEPPDVESQLADEEALELLLYNRQGFTRYLMTRFDQPRPVPVAAKLGFLDFIERLARERGLLVPTDHLNHIRGLIRGGGL